MTQNKEEQFKFLRVIFVHDLLNYTVNREEKKRIIKGFFFLSEKHYSVSKAHV